MELGDLRLYFCQVLLDHRQRISTRTISICCERNEFSDIVEWKAQFTILPDEDES
ncbi:hypothetical protein ALO62_101482 [Pseudomonas amygdali pv. myricae]|uniref:Uncharacterized protein n=3 Tax=Pseudomonas syringae group TaxID=136849 RepID=A0A3M5ZMA0_PSESS|nr:Uncharacterized protein AC510_2484 [Pseudomonas amygdali pv. myricae]KPX09672.1 hypothetical protein ALO74_101293 [Pseudomonas syringae pv. cunninghamiae]KPX15256.1 hypothetical protein ALO73_101343 [Pseudomonas syringae pv. daphniphylli]KPY44056.1 hypothetical protein ALO48_101156 [Pseudomonas syringae pv. rhaphiolepidis]RML97060.1 hypothetical protein ALQ86_101357 [Pseudomonas amygdali pv. eriobotryae]RMS73906.1 hypothetical protein ALP59_101408 [Pseudomonas savastanoi]